MATMEADMMLSLKRINIALQAEANRRSVRAGRDLTAAQEHVLMYILENGGDAACSTRIHREFGLSRGTVSGLLKKLREKGYIRFLSSSTDDRQKPIAVTQKALLLKEALDAGLEQLQLKVFCGFTPQEKRMFYDLECRMLLNLAQEMETETQIREDDLNEGHIGTSQAV